MNRIDAAVAVREPKGIAKTRTADEIDVHSAYDGSNVLFRLLRLTSWGPGLMNLGSFRFRGPLAFINLFINLEMTQQRLVRETLALLDVHEGQRVLDVACGRGKSSFMMHCLHPTAQITGIDLLPTNIDVARLLFGCSPDLQYRQGNAMNLEFPDESFERVQCLEAAFHFPDRSEFLREAYRVLKPGGKLVVVDFAWKSPSARDRLNDPETQLIREIWQWDDMSTIEEYRDSARQAGFRIANAHNWSHRVTAPFLATFHWLLSLGSRGWGRRMLCNRNPIFQNLGDAEWKELRTIADAHEHVNRLADYMAFEFIKPAR